MNQPCHVQSAVHSGICKLFALTISLVLDFPKSCRCRCQNPAGQRYLCLKFLFFLGHHIILVRPPSGRNGRYGTRNEVARKRPPEGWATALAFQILSAPAGSMASCRGRPRLICSCSWLAACGMRHPIMPVPHGPLAGLDEQPPPVRPTTTTTDRFAERNSGGGGAPSSTTHSRGLWSWVSRPFKSPSAISRLCPALVCDVLYLRRAVASLCKETQLVLSYVRLPWEEPTQQQHDSPLRTKVAGAPSHDLLPTCMHMSPG